MQIIRLMPIWSISKFEIFLTFNIPWKLMKFEIHVLEGHSEGNVSHLFYLDHSFHFMQSRKKSFKK